MTATGRPDAMGQAALHTVDVRATIDACIKCDICTAHCPPAQVTPLFPGPKFAGPQAERFRSPLDASADASVDYCNGCRVCNMVCPTGVRIAEVNAIARAAWMRDRGGPPLRNRLLGRSEMLGRLGGPVAPLANRLLASPLVRAAIERVLGIDRRAPLPAFAARTFRGWLGRRPRTMAAGRPRVAYFHGCATNHYEPHVGRAAVHLLEAFGFDVVAPPQNCCSLPLLSNGDFAGARRYHDGNVRKLAGVADAGVPIVGTSTSCTLTLKEEARELLGDDRVGARSIAAATWDICEFLRAHLEAGGDAPVFAPLPLRGPIVYHPPCQLTAHRVGHPAVALLRRVPGLTVRASGQPCCGIAGTYGLKVEKYNIAMAVGRTLFDVVRAAGGDVCACDSETCRWQIESATGTPSVHPVELLAWSCGGPPPPALSRRSPRGIGQGPVQATATADPR